MSNTSSPSRPAAAAQGNLRAYLAGGLVGALTLCLCIVVFGALGGGLYLSNQSKTSVQATSRSPIDLSPLARASTTSQSTLQAALVATGTPFAPASGVAPAPRPTAVPCCTATPNVASNWPVVISDNFASNANGWNIASQPYTNDYGTFDEQITGGTFRVQLKATKDVATEYWLQSVTASDLYLSVDAWRTNGPTTSPYGLIFRRDSRDAYYFFEISDDKRFFVFLYDQGQWTNFISGTGSDAIRPGAVNHLAVIAQGSHCSIFINNQQVGTLNNNRISRGQVGVGFELSVGNQATFEFSNFVLRAP